MGKSDMLYNNLVTNKSDIQGDRAPSPYFFFTNALKNPHKLEAKALNYSGGDTILLPEFDDSRVIIDSMNDIVPPLNGS